MLTRVLGVAGGGVGMVAELSSTVQRRARSVGVLPTITDGSAMKEDATKLDLTLVDALVDAPRRLRRGPSTCGVGSSGF